MNKFALTAAAIAATLALSACGKSDSADELANPDNVEMPAEEAMGTLEAAASPVADPAAASDAAAVPSDAAAAPSDAAAAPSAAAPPAKQ